MIPDKDPINPGMTVRHDEGLLYRVDDVRRSTTGYEVTHELGGLTVNYTQLEQGNFPPGTTYSKDEEGFRTYFTHEDVPGITIDEFIAKWGPGAVRSWAEVGKLAVKRPDFPLRPVADNPAIMTGDLRMAVDWLHSEYGRKGVGVPGFARALEKVQASRVEDPGTTE